MRDMTEQLNKAIKRCVIHLVTKKGLSYSGAENAVNKMVSEYKPEIEAGMHQSVINSLESIFLGKKVTFAVA